MKAKLFDLNKLLSGSLIHLTCKLPQKIDPIQEQQINLNMLQSSAISNILNFITKIKLADNRSYCHTHYDNINKLNVRLSIYNIIDEYNQFKDIHAYNIFTIFESKTLIKKNEKLNLIKNVNLAKKYGTIIVVINYNESKQTNLAMYDHIFSCNIDDINKTLHDNKIVPFVNKHNDILNYVIQKNEISYCLIEENQTSYFKYMTIGKNNLFNLVNLMKLINSNNSIHHLPSGELDLLLKKIHQTYIFAKLWFNTIDDMNTDVCFIIFYKLSLVSKSFFNRKLLEN
uniref:Uncharacterized protein n=1 Tax=viral metagenome TaxID=1070528 RepID=A0A6C0C5S7_9ZZZZ